VTVSTVPYVPRPLPEDPRERRARNRALAVYLLFGAGFFVGVTFLIGVILAYVAREDAPPWLATHFTFQIRTFWLSLFWGVVGFVSAWLVIGLAFLAWGFVLTLGRTIRGFLRLNEDRPIDKPESWSFG